MTRRLALATLATALLVTTALPAHAFQMVYRAKDGRATGSYLVDCDNANGFAHWDVRDIDWYVEGGSNQGKDVGVIFALADAMSSWNAVDDSDYVLSFAGQTSAGWATDDRNTLIWASGNGCTGTCLGLTALVVYSNVIVESDITFNADYTWKTDGNDYDVEAVAVHEFGHSLGIHHSEVTTSWPTMRGGYNGTAMRSLESDDEEALQCSEWRYCVNRRMTADGSFNLYNVEQRAKLEWNTCLLGANVDVFRDGVKVKTTPNDGLHTHKQSGFPGEQATYWVCDAGSTSTYDAATCSDQQTVTFD